MIRTFTAILLAFAASSALAQTAAQREACKDDYAKYCKGTMPGGGRIVACLEKHNDALSAACRKAIADSKKK